MSISPEGPFLAVGLCGGFSIDCCIGRLPAGIPTPALGTAECRLTARLVVQSDVTEQHHRLVLADPEVAAFAPPADGTSP